MIQLLQCDSIKNHKKDNLFIYLFIPFMLLFLLCSFNLSFQHPFILHTLISFSFHLFPLPSFLHFKHRNKLLVFLSTFHSTALFISIYIDLTRRYKL